MTNCTGLFLFKSDAFYECICFIFNSNFFFWHRPKRVKGLCSVVFARSAGTTFRLDVFICFREKVPAVMTCYRVWLQDGCTGSPSAGADNFCRMTFSNVLKPVAKKITRHFARAMYLWRLLWAFAFNWLHFESFNKSRARRPRRGPTEGARVEFVRQARTRRFRQQRTRRSRGGDGRSSCITQLDMPEVRQPLRRKRTTGAAANPGRGDIPSKPARGEHCYCHREDESQHWERNTPSKHQRRTARSASAALLAPLLLLPRRALRKAQSSGSRSAPPGWNYR